MVTLILMDKEDERCQQELGISLGKYPFSAAKADLCWPHNRKPPRERHANPHKTHSLDVLKLRAASAALGSIQRSTM